MTQSAARASGTSLSASQQRPQQQADAAEYYGLYKTARTLAKSYQAVAHQKDDQVKALTREMEELKLKLQLMEAQQQQLDQPSAPTSQGGTVASRQFIVDGPAQAPASTAADSVALQLTSRAPLATARSSSNNNGMLASPGPQANAAAAPQRAQQQPYAQPAPGAATSRGFNTASMRRSADLHMLLSAQMLQRNVSSAQRAPPQPQPPPAHPVALQHAVSYRDPAAAAAFRAAPAPPRSVSASVSADMWQVQVPEGYDVNDADADIHADGGKVKKVKGKIGQAFKKLMSKSWRGREDASSSGGGSAAAKPTAVAMDDAALGGSGGGAYMYASNDVSDPAAAAMGAFHGLAPAYQGVGISALPAGPYDAPSSLQPVLEDGLGYDVYDTEPSAPPTNSDCLNLAPPPPALHPTASNKAAPGSAHAGISVTLPSEYLMGALSPQDQMAAAAAAGPHRPAAEHPPLPARQLMHFQSLQATRASPAQQQQQPTQVPRSLSQRALPGVPNVSQGQQMVADQRTSAPAGLRATERPAAVDASRTSGHVVNAGGSADRRISGGTEAGLPYGIAPAPPGKSRRTPPGPGSVASTGAGSEPSTPDLDPAAEQQSQRGGGSSLRRSLKHNGSLKVAGESVGAISWSGLMQRSGLGQVAAKLRNSIPGSSRSTLERNSWDGGSSGGGAPLGGGAAGATARGTGGGFISSAASVQSWSSDAPPMSGEVPAAAGQSPAGGVRTSAPARSGRNVLTSSLSSLNLRAAAAQLSNLPPRPSGRAAAGHPPLHPPAHIDAVAYRPGSEYGTTGEPSPFNTADQDAHTEEPPPPPPAPIPATATATDIPRDTRPDEPAPTSNGGSSRTSGAAPDAYLEGILGRLKTPGVLLQPNPSGAPAVTASWAGPLPTSNSYRGAGEAAATELAGAPTQDPTVLRRDFTRGVGVSWRHKSLGRNTGHAPSFHEKTLPRASMQGPTSSPSMERSPSQRPSLTAETFVKEQATSPQDLLVRVDTHPHDFPTDEVSFTTVTDAAVTTPRSHPVPNVPLEVSLGGCALAGTAVAAPSSSRGMYGTGMDMPIGLRSPEQQHAHEAALWRSRSPKARASARENALTERSPSPKSIAKVAAAAAARGAKKTLAVAVAAAAAPLPAAPATAANQAAAAAATTVVAVTCDEGAPRPGVTKSAAADQKQRRKAVTPQDQPTRRQESNTIPKHQQDNVNSGADTLWFAPMVGAVSALTPRSSSMAAAGRAGKDGSNSRGGHSRYAATAADGDSSSGPSTSRSGTWSTDPSPREHDVAEGGGHSADLAKPSSSASTSSASEDLRLRKDVVGTVSSSSVRRQSLLAGNTVEDAALQALPSARTVATARTTGGRAGAAAASAAHGRPQQPKAGVDGAPANTQGSGATVSPSSAALLLKQDLADAAASDKGTPLSARKSSAVRRRSLAAGLEAADSGSMGAGVGRASGADKDDRLKGASAGTSTVAALKAAARQDDTRRASDGGLIAPDAGPVPSVYTKGSPLMRNSNRTRLEEPLAAPRAHHKGCSDGAVEELSHTLTVAHAELLSPTCINPVPPFSKLLPKDSVPLGNISQLQLATGSSNTKQEGVRSSVCLVSAPHVQQFETQAQKHLVGCNATALGSASDKASQLLLRQPQQEEQRRHRAAVTIQTAWRAARARARESLARLLQAVEEAEMRLREEERQEAAATSIQRAWRAHRLRVRSRPPVPAAGLPPRTAFTVPLAAPPVPASGAETPASTPGRSTRTGPATPVLVLHPLSQQQPVCVRLPSVARLCTSGVTFKRRLFYEQQRRTSLGGSLEQQQFQQMLQANAAAVGAVGGGGMASGCPSGPGSSELRFRMLRGGGQSDGGWLGYWEPEQEEESARSSVAGTADGAVGAFRYPPIPQFVLPSADPGASDMDYDEGDLLPEDETDDPYIEEDDEGLEQLEDGSDSPLGPLPPTPLSPPSPFPEAEDETGAEPRDLGLLLGRIASLNIASADTAAATTSKTPNVRECAVDAVTQGNTSNNKNDVTVGATRPTEGGQGSEICDGKSRQPESASVPSPRSPSEDPSMLAPPPMPSVSPPPRKQLVSQNSSPLCSPLLFCTEVMNLAAKAIDTPPGGVTGRRSCVGALMCSTAADSAGAGDGKDASLLNQPQPQSSMSQRRALSASWDCFSSLAERRHDGGAGYGIGHGSVARGGGAAANPLRKSDGSTRADVALLAELAAAAMDSCLGTSTSELRLVPPSPPPRPPLRQPVHEQPSDRKAASVPGEQKQPAGGIVSTSAGDRNSDGNSAGTDKEFAKAVVAPASAAAPSTAENDTTSSQAPPPPSASNARRRSSREDGPTGEASKGKLPADGAVTGRSELSDVPPDMVLAVTDEDELSSPSLMLEPASARSPQGSHNGRSVCDLFGRLSINLGSPPDDVDGCCGAADADTAGTTAASPVRWHTSQLWEFVHQHPVTPPSLTGTPGATGAAIITGPAATATTTASLSRRSWPCAPPSSSSALTPPCCNTNPPLPIMTSSALRAGSGLAAAAAAGGRVTVSDDFSDVAPEEVEPAAAGDIVIGGSRMMPRRLTASRLLPKPLLPGESPPAPRDKFSGDRDRVGEEEAEGTVSASPVRWHTSQLWEFVHQLGGQPQLTPPQLSGDRLALLTPRDSVNTGQDARAGRRSWPGVMSTATVGAAMPPLPTPPGSSSKGRKTPVKACTGGVAVAAAPECEGVGSVSVVAGAEAQTAAASTGVPVRQVATLEAASAAPASPLPGFAGFSLIGGGPVTSPSFQQDSQRRGDDVRSQGSQPSSQTAQSGSSSGLLLLNSDTISILQLRRQQLERQQQQQQPQQQPIKNTGGADVDCTPRNVTGACPDIDASPTLGLPPSVITGSGVEGCPGRRSRSPSLAGGVVEGEKAKVGADAQAQLPVAPVGNAAAAAVPSAASASGSRPLSSRGAGEVTAVGMLQLVLAGCEEEDSVELVDKQDDDDEEEDGECGVDEGEEEEGLELSCDSSDAGY